MWFLPFLLLGCPHPAKLPEPGSLADIPHLPAPEGQLYTTLFTRPADPVVASVVEGLPWEETLSGAAGALGLLALRNDPPDLWDVRWAALRAGFIHPVAQLQVMTGPIGAVPPDLASQISALLEPGDALGLARVRGGQSDAWVILVGRPRLDLAPFPRQVHPDQEFVFFAEGAVAPAGLLLTYVSPRGSLGTIPLEGQGAVLLPEGGEWWLELSRGEEIFASFPVFSGVSPPTGVPLDNVAPDRPGGHRGQVFERGLDPSLLEDATWDLLDEVRDMFAWASPAEDPILDARARAMIRSRLGIGPPPGTPPANVSLCQTSLRCDLSPGGDVLTCFQDWFVTPADRAALIHHGCTLAGVAAMVHEFEGRSLGIVDVEMGQE